MATIDELKEMALQAGMQCMREGTVGQFIIEQNIYAQQPQLQHFPLTRNDIYLKKLYQFLTHKGWIEENTHPDNFVYLMGGLERSPMVKTIQWRETLQLLREMLEIVFLPSISNGIVKKADIEKITPLCFSKDAKPAILPPTKHKDCNEYTLLVNFLASIA